MNELGRCPFCGSVLIEKGRGIFQCANCKRVIWAKFMFHWMSLFSILIWRNATHYSGF